jgi:hypothetical protein
MSRIIISRANVSRAKMSRLLSFSGVRAGCWHIFLLACSVLREIFDESAYARFLDRHRLGTSPEAYAAFLRETEATRQRRPRCC